MVLFLIKKWENYFLACSNFVHNVYLAVLDALYKKSKPASKEVLIDGADSESEDGNEVGEF